MWPRDAAESGETERIKGLIEQQDVGGPREETRDRAELGPRACVCTPPEPTGNDVTRWGRARLSHRAGLVPQLLRFLSKRALERDAKPHVENSTPR